MIVFQVIWVRVVCLFFWRGQTLAVLKAMGKEPVHEDMLTMAGSRYGRQSEKRDAGMVLRSHDLKDIDF